VGRRLPPPGYFGYVEPVAVPELTTPVREIARSDFVRLSVNESVAEALNRLRGEALGERIVYFYVTRQDGVLEGVVPTRRLLLSQADVVIRDLMVSPVVSVRESDSFGQALAVLTERRLLALPVVNGEGRLTGVVDISILTETALDLERRESAEEAFQLAGVRIEAERGRHISRTLRDRFPWLLANIAGGLGAALVSSYFEGLLRSVVALALFMPLLLTVAEGVAMQSLALSLRHFSHRGAPRGAGAREVRTGALLGLGGGATVALLCLVGLGHPEIAGVLAAGLTAAGAIGAGMGFGVPRLAARRKLNPSVASGPVTLALTDVLALVCYFGLASFLVG
jgi:magnesium transporter